MLLAYPSGFHPGVIIGCARPLASVAWAQHLVVAGPPEREVDAPALPGQAVRRRLDTGWRQVWPKSIETSTARTVAVAGPGVTRDLERLADGVCRAGRRPRDERLHRHRLEDAHVLLGDLGARRDRRAGHAIGGPVIFAPSCTRSRTAMRRSHLPDADPGQPGNQTQRRAVKRRQRPRRSSPRPGASRPPSPSRSARRARSAPRASCCRSCGRRPTSRRRPRLLHAGALQYVAQPHPVQRGQPIAPVVHCEPADRGQKPRARCRRTRAGARASACEVASELGERELDRALDRLAVDEQRPRRRHRSTPARRRCCARRGSSPASRRRRAGGPESRR